jgi:hypothetical protein
MDAATAYESVIVDREINAKGCHVTGRVVCPLAGFDQLVSVMLWRWAIPDTASARVLAARR